MLKKFALCVALASVTFSAPAFALDEAKAKELMATKFNAWINNPTVIDAIKSQNDKNAALTEAEIVDLDNKWRNDDEALVNGVLTNELSAYLKGVVEEGGGMYSEIFVMDNKGLNVGQSDKTSDYWQGDEAKWQKTFSMGPDALHVSEVEFDESSQTYQVQISATISDGETAIGAVTIGVDAESVE